ncbi:MAG: 3-phosphoshikimate 1-carboxyvinyltransferase [Candidatus Thalassarchaeaceae archaeon]|jgi:3-phosphoshikimate 1-carboxyvinyltransferase
MEIFPIKLSDPIHWSLPPSKSHMIRWLMLAFQSKNDVIIKFDGTPGDDIMSAVYCLNILGLEVEDNKSYWKIFGEKKTNKGSKIILNCGNSGTTVNFLTAITSMMNKEVTIEGDESLKKRDFSHLNKGLRKLGCDISGDSPPYTILGPITKKRVELGIDISSQPLSAIILSSPTHNGEIIIDTIGKSVSSEYGDLTIEIAEKCGIKITRNKDEIIVNAAHLELPDVVEIPSESSLIPIAILLSELHDVELILSNNNKNKFLDSGIDILKSKGLEKINLSDYSDMITPAAVLLAITGGGEITGVKHARGKESDRIENTKNLIEDFGMECEVIGDELKIPGYQKPQKPQKSVETYDDHRIAMTAIVLATLTGANIINPEISSVTDPEFLDKINNIII